MNDAEARFALYRGTDLAAQRIGDQLVPEAYPERRPVELSHPMLYCAFFGDKPGMFGFLPYILRASEHDQGVERFEVRNGRGFVEAHDVRINIRALQWLAQHPERTIRGVLEYERTHWHISPS
jgi:hypothetical protein